MLRDLQLFDRYVGKGVESGFKSLAMGLILQEDSRPLTDREVDEVVAAVTAALESTHAARIRGRRGTGMALTKAEMAERLYEEVGLNKREAKEFVDAFFDALREGLQAGRQVKLSGLGNFALS